MAADDAGRGRGTMKRVPMPTSCPVTGGPLLVTRLESEESGIKIEGRFVPNEFALLPADNLEFLRLYIRCRGNLKEVERIMGLSYPTVRARFEKLLQALGYEAEPDLEELRNSVLDRLERGEIDPTEASKLLRGLK